MVLKTYSCKNLQAFLKTLKVNFAVDVGGGVTNLLDVRNNYDFFESAFFSIFCGRKLPKSTFFRHFVQEKFCFQGKKVLARYTQHNRFPYIKGETKINELITEIE